MSAKINITGLAKWSTLGWDYFHGEGTSFSFIHKHVIVTVWRLEMTLTVHDAKAIKQMGKFEKKNVRRQIEPITSLVVFLNHCAPTARLKDC